MSNRAQKNGFLLDGNIDFSGGQDSSRNPSQIDRDQVSNAVNATMRSGTPSPRPGFVKRVLDFSDSPLSQTPFQTGRFQQGDFYDGNGIPSLLSSQSGRLFKIDIKTLKVSEITPRTNATTTTTADFVIPAVNTSVIVQVADTSKMFGDLTAITIGAYSFALYSIDSPTQIHVSNTIATQVGNTVTHPAAVTFQTYDLNDDMQRIGWSLQAENYWIYQDNIDRPIIFDGGGTRRADPTQNEIPVGNVMWYAAGRIGVALPDRQTFRMGDIVFGASGTAINGGRDAILKFTENNYLNEGGDFVARVFGAPSNAGPIMAAKACAQTDAQLGQGAVIVGTPNTVFTLNLPYDRTTWKNMSNAIQTANPVLGPLGQRSTVLVNTDLWYRALDGIRSWIMAQRQFNNSWGNTPMSQELDDLLDNDTQFLLEWGSAVLFNNRLLMTVSPVDSEHGVWHRGLVALDFNLVSTIRKKTAPAWEGVWSGVRILQIIRCLVDQKERCFMYVLNGTNNIELWEIDPSQKSDQGGTPIQWSLDSPSYNCGNSDEFKRLETARIIVWDLEGTVNCTVKYRTDLNPCWINWANFPLCAKNKDCGPPDGTCAPHTYREQERTPVKLPMPADDFDPITNRKNRTGFEFQVRLELSGWLQLRQFRIYCLPEPESINAERTIV